MSHSRPLPEGTSTAMTTALATPYGPLGRFTAALSVQTQAPVDLAVLMALGTLSAATHGRWHVRIGPDRVEPLALHTAALAPSGTRKSAVFAAITRSLLDRERQLIEATRIERAAAAAARAIHDAISETEEVELVETPRPAQRLAFGGVQAGELAALLSEHGGTGAIVYDGGDLLDDLAHRAGDDDRRFALRTLAAGHEGTRLRFADGQDSQDSIDIPHPFLAVVLTGVPDVIADAHPDVCEDLLPQFLFALPASPIGWRAVDVPSVPEDVQAAWNRAVGDLIEVALAADKVSELALDPQAEQIFTAFRHAWWEPRLHPETGDLADIQPWAARLPGQLVRIAALLTLADDPHGTTVAARHVRTALTMAEPLTAHARAALALAAPGEGRA